jgi:hypothetical protein
MSHFEGAEKHFFAGLAVAALLIVQAVAAPVEGVSESRLAAMPEVTGRVLAGAASLHLRFVQEEGPDSGHVRVELTPTDRALNAMEARTAAQQAFLEALDEPALDGVSRIVVAVDLVADTDDPALKRTYLFLAQGGGSWSVMMAD